MRLPLSKIWRAFPELDRFDDTRCRRYVVEAARVNRRSGCVILLLIPLAIAGWLVSIGLSIAILDLLVPGNQGPGWYFTAVALVIFAAPPLLMGVTILLARDRWLRRAVRDRLNVARCLGCSYSLLGLTPVEGRSGQRHVTCPECGKPGEVTDEMMEQMLELGVVVVPAPAAPPTTRPTPSPRSSA